jgi:hypothetical protein
MICSACIRGNLLPTGLGVPDRYDYAVLCCSRRRCGYRVAIQVVELKRQDRELYDQMVRTGMIDRRYNVIRLCQVA